MWLVHEDKAKDGRWQVAWMWLPHFLASDQSLHRYVADKMTEEFKGTMFEDDISAERTVSILKPMHDRVVGLILERYPIRGLKEYLNAIQSVSPEES